MNKITRPASRVHEQSVGGDSVPVGRLLARDLDRSASTMWRGAQSAWSHGRPERAQELEKGSRKLEELAELVHATFWKPDVEPPPISASERSEVLAILDRREAARTAPKLVRPLPVSGDRRARYGDAALFGECKRVADEAPGNRNNVLTSASFRIGQLIGSGLVDPTYAFGNLLSAALAAGLTEREARGVIRSGLAAGAQKPREPAA